MANEIEALVALAAEYLSCSKQAVDAGGTAHQPGPRLIVWPT